MNKHFRSFIYNIDDLISVIALIGITFVTSLNVFLRFVVKDPLHWNEEVALGLFVWLTFIGMSTVFKEGGHVSIDYFVNKLPSPIRRSLDIIRYFVIYLTLLIIFVYLGFILTIETTRVTSALSINYMYIYMAVPLGGILSCIYLTLHLFNKKGRGN